MEDWYTMEQQIRDRLAEARSASRWRVPDATAKARPFRLIQWVWARAVHVPLELSFLIRGR